MNIENTIRESFFETLEAHGDGSQVELTSNTILLDSGLDSLGFAVLVARLEEVLDYDPFTLMDEVVYPKTYGEFVEVYEKYGDYAKSS